MRTFGEHLDTYIELLGLENDNQLAKHLGVSRQYVWKLRHNGKASDELCLEIAKVVQAEGAEVLIARNAIREQGPVGDAWRRYNERVNGASLYYRNLVHQLLRVFSHLASGPRTGNSRFFFACRYPLLPTAN